MKAQRLIYADLLRVIATFVIVILHVSGSNWHNVPVSGFEWKVFNFYDSMARFSVPVFVMISGMFLLDNKKSLTLKKLYSKNILRIVTSFIFWSAIYSVFTNILKYNTFNQEVLKHMVISFITGNYHLWFLFMIVGLYIITPILRKITESENRFLIEYFLILAAFFQVIIPTLLKVPVFSKRSVIINTVINKVNMKFVLGYVGYYVAGYYFKTYDIPSKAKYAIYTLGILGFISTYVLTDVISQNKGVADGTFYGYFYLNVMCSSIAVFILFKDKVSKIKFKERTCKIITILSNCSFGIYLVHDFFITIFQKHGFSTISFNSIAAVPIISLSVFIISFLVSYIISKIPFLNKYII